MGGWTLHETSYTLICNVANNKLNPLTAKSVGTGCAVIPGCFYTEYTVLNIRSRHQIFCIVVPCLECLMHHMK